ncbi:MAG: hypothetical protein EBQ80_04695 [Proteobacteria bacterium]|nr:hypothetical protein [Pseudomonadota bacterium]
MLHVTMVDPHPQTPCYLLTCAHTWHRTIVDPTSPKLVQAALAENKLDLILITAMNEATLASAEILHHRTSAPILGGEYLKETALPVARYLEDGAVVGLGPLAQTILLPHGNILCYAMGSEGVVFTGPLFATGLTHHKTNKKALLKLQNLPEETMACGGGAHNLPLVGLLTATRAS